MRRGLIRAALPASLLLMVSGATTVLAGEPLELKSPDGNLAVVFELKQNPQPYLPGERAYYRVSYKGTEVLADSPLGLDFKDAAALDHDFEVTGSKRDSHDSSWENAFGDRRQVRDHYNQLTVSLRERSEPHRRVDLIFRAYDEGIALRYFLPAQEGLQQFTLSSENTGFYFAGEAFAYALNLGSYTSSYEGDYHRISLNQIKPTSLVALPLLVEIPQGPWVALLEADLSDYAGMYLGGVPGVSNALESRLSPHPDHCDEAVTASTPKATPWRIVLVNSRPGGLIESSDLELNLSAPSALPDTSWIEPGKSAWDWWSGSYASGVSFKPGMNTATMEHYVDFAAAHHLTYMLIDAGWYPAKDDTHPMDILHHTPETDVPAIVQYAKAKGVKGMEYIKWSPRLPPQHDVTLPFTRMLAGPMDYTPGCFNNAARSQFRPRNVQPMCQGTRAHQLAMYVDFLSPLVMLSDYPEDYDDNPGMAFLDQVPMVWDDTRVLNGAPAKFVTIVRRHGDAWYLGAMTNWDARDLDVPLDFLSSGEYQAQIFADGPDAETNAKSLAISARTIKAADHLKLHLASGGGAAVIFTPEK